MSAPLSIADYERLAEERLEPGAWAYLAGGSGDEWTLRENRAAFARWTFRPRVLCDVSRISTATTVLGQPIELPVVVGPVAYQQLYHPDGECATARAAAAAGTAMAVSTFGTRSHEEIAAAAPGLRQWCQLYVFQDRGVTREHLAGAANAGCSAVVLTVDTPRLAQRERDIRAGFEVPSDLPLPYARSAVGDAASNPSDQFAMLDASLSWRDLEWVAGEGRLPIVLKGIVTAEDAQLAVEHGAAAIVVSNHGGRQLDGAPATLDALPEVVEAVGGRAEVYLDGGIRRGTDVAKALALGARAVLAGRAPVFGLAAAGEDGVRHVLELLREELALTLCLLGCSSPGRADASARPTLPCVSGRLSAMYALNFYSPLVADQLRSGRKSATIRLGDKSGKYKKGMVVRVLCGVRFSPREHVFDAVIDKVEVKTLGELSPREIEHDNPEIRRTDEMGNFLGQLYNREVGLDDRVTVIRFSQIMSGPVVAGFREDDLF